MIATQAATRATRAAGIAVAGLSGAIFGIGLAVSRMTNPQKVKDFLDIAAISQGGWDPSLAFVMGGAALVAFFGLRINRLIRKPIISQSFSLLPAQKIDRPLVVGAALFGVGWGISGLCPGPAIANLGIVPSSVALFIAAMLAGSWLAGALPRFKGNRQVLAAAAEQ
jgi:uncharacterized membrane protein YedE/YeeE